MTRLAILGASGHGKVVADIAECCGWHQVDFFDDSWPGIQQNGHWIIVGDSKVLFDKLADYDGIVVAIGNNTIRHQKIHTLKSAGACLVSLFHPTSTISRYACVGLGSVAMAGVIVNSGVTVGDGAILNTGCSVDHDCVLGESVHISPGAHLAGDVQLGDCCWVGIGASVRQGITVGARSVIGAGAAVVCDLREDVTAVGVPARVLICR